MDLDEQIAKLKVILDIKDDKRPDVGDFVVQMIREVATSEESKDDDLKADQLANNKHDIAMKSKKIIGRTVLKNKDES